MTYGEAVTGTVKGLATQPGFLLIAVLNVGMIAALLYVANAQRDERQLLTKNLLENCRGVAPVIDLIEQLRRERLEAGWSQHVLARKAGYSANDVWRWETGRAQPRLNSLVAWTEALGKRLALADAGETPMIDREKFFTSVRESLFNGVLTQRQVDAMSYLLDVWERHFVDKDIRWLAYALATVFHETAYTMEPIEEYGRGSGKPYGEAVGPHHECYYGRGYPQLTWEDNYKKAQQFLSERYSLDVPMHEYPHRMLEHEPSALVLYDGSIHGWFTGVGLPAFFDADTEDPYNARKVINGLDHASTIEGYYGKFKDALT